MSDDDGRSLVAAYLQRLWLSRGVEQGEVAARLGLHKNTVFRAMQPDGRHLNAKLETAIAITRELGGNVAHITALRAGTLPADYPRDRMDVRVLSVDVAADVAQWWVEMQDAELRKAAQRAGLPPLSVVGLISSLQWLAFREPGQVLKVYL